MIPRIRPAVAPALFALILLNLACSGFFSLYWLKNNDWALDPVETSIAWLSDEDYRAIATSSATEYRLADGRTLVLPTNAGDRKAFLARYDLGTPDGRWHGRGSQRGRAPTVQTWFGLALPVFVLSAFGLFACRPGRGKPVPAESEAFANV